MVHKVWPANESFDSDNQNHLSFPVGGRCPCWRRIDFNIQCKHELKINPKFKNIIGDIDGTTGKSTTGNSLLTQISIFIQKQLPLMKMITVMLV